MNDIYIHVACSNVMFMCNLCTFSSVHTVLNIIYQFAYDDSFNQNHTKPMENHNITDNSKKPSLQSTK